jgi:hypothetical protein
MKRSLVTPSLVEIPLGLDAGPNSNPVGLICAANESRFTSANYSEPLTALTIGWKDPENIDALLERLFPTVPVAKRFTFKKATNAQAFLSEIDDLRTSGTPFKRIEYSGTEADARTYNKGLTIRIDHDECDDLEAEVTTAVGRLQQRLARNELRRGITLLDTADHAGGNTAFKADTNPDGLIRAMGLASANTSGLFPNVYAIGELAWHYRLDAYEAPARVNGGNRAAFTTAQVAQYLGADVVEIVKARYQSSATAKTAILSARIYAYSAFAGASKDDPSAIKRFRSSTKGGGQVAVYRQDYEKFTDVSVEHYSNIVATGVGVESIDATNA